jgi:ABC-type multidrug transport system ATPase subunit
VTLAEVATEDPSVAGAVAIRTRNLTRRFGSHTAVGGVDLEVPRGAVFGFLGPNGSGKTTTIRMLLGLVAPHDGDVTVLGGSIPGDGATVLPKVGSLVEGPAFHPYLPGRENLRRLDRFDATADPATSDDRIDAALARVGLTAAAGKLFRRYSLGMKQRLGLAAALLQPRELLILDEPTNGLDPQGTREVRAIVRELAHDGTTVLVSSHLLSEVEQVATHVGIMSTGRLLRQGTLDEVLSYTATQVRVTTPDVARAVGVLADVGVSPVHELTGEVTGRLNDVAPEVVTAALVAAGVAVRGIVVERPALEDLFVELTGEGFDGIR